MQLIVYKLFFTYIVFNVDNLINIVRRLLKLSVLILVMIMEGTVSQIFIFKS